MKLLTNIKKSLYKFNYIDDVIRNKWILFKFNQAVKQGKLNQNQTTIHSDIIFRDEFNNLGLDKFKWNISQPWGSYHPINPYVYYSKKGVTIENSNLILSTIKHPVREDNMTFPYIVGLIQTYNHFVNTYGYYEMKAKMDKGVASWFAFWLTGNDGWPPELDIFELYGEKDGSKITTLKTTLHWKKEGQHKQHTFKAKLPENINTEYHIYAMDWKKDYIRFYFDNVLYCEIKNKYILSYFNQPMVLILNNSLEQEYIKYLKQDNLPHNFYIDSIIVYKN